MSRLTTSDALLAKALDAMGEASLITDANQLIVYANAAFAEVTGYSSDEVVGLNCRLLQDTATDPATVARISAALGAGEVFRGEILNRKKNGPLFWNSVTISPIRDEAGTISNFVSVQVDVTERVLTEQGQQGSTSVLATGTLEMHMQPIIDLTDGSTVMVEALARLSMPDGRMITAAEFVPTLSELELETLFVDGLDRALRYLAEWDDGGLALSISVNLDPFTLSNPLCATWVRDALIRNGIAAGRLTLELLETQAIDSAEQALVIAELAGLGVQFAIDDLGSGHSNLERLAHIPFDLVKIDSSIMAGFASAPVQTLSVVSALVQLSHELGRVAVIEGLETLGMLCVATALDAPLGQGYQIARPMPAADIPHWIAHTPRRNNSDPYATAAGALAWHWRHSRETQHEGELVDCPISAFLASCVSDQPIQEWHASQHGVGNAEDARALTEFLVGLIE
jgi:PAS domain S-box-containing protein